MSLLYQNSYFGNILLESSHDFPLLFGVDIQTTMSKGDRLLYGESAMTHAMVFTAVHIDVSSPLHISPLLWSNLII